MKKTIRLVAVAMFCAATALTSCGDSKKQCDAQGGEAQTELSTSQKIKLRAFEKEMGRVNKQLPMDMGQGLTLVKAEIKDGFMTNTHTYKKGTDITIDNTEESKKAIKGAVGESINRLKELNLGVKYIYKEEGSSTENVITITPDEM